MTKWQKVKAFVLHALGRIEHMLVAGCSACVAATTHHVLEMTINGGLVLVIVVALYLEFKGGNP